MPSLEELSPRKQLLVFAILAVVLIGVAEYLWLSNISQTNDGLKNKVDAVRLSNRQLEALVARMPEMQRQVEVLKKRLAQLEQIVPPRTQTGRFIRELESNARDSGVYIRQVTSQSTNHHSFYVAAPYTLMLDGSYTQLANFYARLAVMPRIVNVENLQFQHLSRGSGGLFYHPAETVSVGCVITTYYSRHGSLPALRRP